MAYCARVSEWMPRADSLGGMASVIAGAKDGSPSCTATLVLIAAWHGPWPLEIMAIAVVQVAAAAVGLPPMLRLALALQRPSAHRAPGDAAGRRLAVAFAVAVVANAGLMLASAAVTSA